MVFTTEVDSIHVHATIISPVVGQSQDKLHVSSFGSFNNHIKLAQIDLDTSILLKPLKNSVLCTSVILWQSALREGSVVVMESPSTNNLQASILGSFKTKLDILVMVCSPLQELVSSVV